MGSLIFHCRTLFAIAGCSEKTSKKLSKKLEKVCGNKKK